MQNFSRSGLAAAIVALMTVSGVALAQTTPNSGAAGTAPEATTAPAATTTTTPSTAQSDSTATEKAAAKKKKTTKKMTRQQEIDHSIDTGAVPARYRSSVPKQYQHYVPFEKR
jgi:hypothetical protein